MTQLFHTQVSSPIGIIKIVCDKNKLISLDFVNKLTKTNENKLTLKAKKQLQEYFCGKRKNFSLKMNIHGTHFEKNVWKQILKIKFGETLSYKKIAILIKNPKAYRAVANACGKNKLPIIIPCHRVLASNGIGGYSAGIKKKLALLKIESADIKSF